MMDANSILDAAGIEKPPSLNLPDEFYSSRPILAHIQQAARAARCAPDFVLGATLARVSMLTPPSILPPIVRGRSSTFNWFALLLGAPEAGKSTSIGTARQLLPTIREDIQDSVPVGTGEGISQAFLGEVVTSENGDKPTKALRQVYSSILVVIDEGQALTELGNRKGATLLPTLRSGYSGTDLGQTNAKVETRRLVREGKYRLAIIAGFQPVHALQLLNDEKSGTPQRFHWFHAFDIGAPDRRPEWPGLLPWHVPPSYEIPTVMEIDDAIYRAIDDDAVRSLRGRSIDGDARAHQVYSQLKFGSLLAILDDRRRVNGDDWELATIAMATCTAVRESVAIEARREIQRKTEEGNRQAAIRTTTVEEHQEHRAKVSMGRSMANRARTVDHPLTKRELTHAVAGKYRALVSIDEAIDYAVSCGWLRPEGEAWAPGTAAVEA